MNAVDTNVWIYRHDSRDPQKQAIADQLIVTVRPLVLLWQVGCEFIAASRKLVALGFTEDQAWAALTDMQSIASRVALPDVQVWTEGQALQKTPFPLLLGWSTRRRLHQGRRPDIVYREPRCPSHYRWPVPCQPLPNSRSVTDVPNAITIAGGAVGGEAVLAIIFLE